MGFMMLYVEERTLVAKFFAEEMRDPELLLHPALHRLKVLHVPKGPCLKERCEYAIEEFEEGFLVETNSCDILHCNFLSLQRVFNCIMWKRFIVLLPRETFFLRCEHDLAILQEHGGAIVVEAGNAEDIDGVWAGAGAWHALKWVSHIFDWVLLHHNPKGIRLFPKSGWKQDDLKNDGIDPKPHDPKSSEDDRTHHHAKNMAESHPAFPQESQW